MANIVDILVSRMQKKAQSEYFLENAFISWVSDNWEEIMKDLEKSYGLYPHLLVKRAMELLNIALETDDFEDWDEFEEALKKVVTCDETLTILTLI